MTDTKEDLYLEAARTMGSSTSRVLMRHILPNIMAPIIVLYTTMVPGIILSEASLSFLGLGIPPPTPSWGACLVRKGSLICCGGPGWQYGRVWR